GDGHVLLLAATAALIDRRPERAQVFLKRFSKRFVAIGACHLLRALAIAQEDRIEAARSLLEAHGLADRFSAMQNFPGGWMRREWLFEQHDRIVGRSRKRRESQRNDTAKRRRTPRAVPSKPADPAVRPPEPTPPGLPLIDIDIPISATIDLAPLLAAMARPSSADGNWHGLRERHAHLGLAQGFDELLCLPHLHGIETFWYQVETVRKVLKQFRGRVLLADEVGLGKTIEAGMVLKEYLLRGMVESALVLTPASLVGQWREELAAKFDIACATTYDPLLRSDPDRFWSQN